MVRYVVVAACWILMTHTPHISDIALSSGPTIDGIPVSTEKASALLDKSLAQERLRCVRHRCLCPFPLPLLEGPLETNLSPSPLGIPQTPVQVPKDWSTPAGSGNRHSQRSRHGQGDVHAVPVLTRLRSTSQFSTLLLDTVKEFGAAVQSPWGWGELNRWGAERGDEEQTLENLRNLAGKYDVDYDDGDWMG